MPDKPPHQPQNESSMSSVPIPPPSGYGSTGDLSLLRAPPMPSDMGMSTAQFINDLREVVPSSLQRSSWMYSANLIGLGAYSPRMAEAIRHRYKEYTQYLKMSVSRSKITPEFSLWLNNLRLLGLTQSARATRPDTERRMLATNTSEIITTPPTKQRRKFLGL